MWALINIKQKQFITSAKAFRSITPLHPENYLAKMCILTLSFRAFASPLHSTLQGILGFEKTLLRMHHRRGNGYTPLSWFVRRYIIWSFLFVTVIAIIWLLSTAFGYCRRRRSWFHRSSRRSFLALAVMGNGYRYWWWCRLSVLAITEDVGRLRFHYFRSSSAASFFLLILLRVCGWCFYRYCIVVRCFRRSLSPMLLRLMLTIFLLLFLPMEHSYLRYCS